MGSKPLFVLTALDHYGNLSHVTAKQRVEAQWFERMNAHAQARWLKLSNNSESPSDRGADITSNSKTRP